MSLPEFKQIIDDNIERIGSISLYNYGEPLLNKNIYGMIRYAKSRGVTFVKLATNGIELNPKNCGKIVISGLDHLSVSIDAVTSKTYDVFRRKGDFESVIRNIRNLVLLRNLRETGMKIELQFIIMRHNEHEVLSVEKLARGLKVDILRLKTALVKKKRWGCYLPENAKYNRYTLKSQASCDKPLHELVINSDGTVLPCCYIVGDDIKRFSLGNIFEHSLKEIILSQKYRRFTDSAVSNRLLLTCCKKCREPGTDIDFKYIRLTGAKIM